MQPAPDTAPLDQLLAAVTELRAGILTEAEPTLSAWRAAITDPDFLRSAENLAHFLALRRRDLTELQRELSTLGLSSLGRGSRRVLPNLEAVLASLQAIAGVARTVAYPSSSSHGDGERLARLRTAQLFGPDPGGPVTRIMVTLDERVRADVDQYVDLISAGADVARLNAAHGTPDVWAEQVAVWRVAAARCGRAGTVEFDLSGPKVRVAAVDRDEDRSKRLSIGDRFVLCDGTPAGWSRWEDTARAHAAPNFPGLLQDLVCCNTVHYDDGVLSAIVVETSPEAALLEVTNAAEDGVRLRVSKGLNFSGVELRLPVLGPQDAEALDFAAAHADVIGLSFVQRPEDVVRLQRELEARCGGRTLPGVVLKIETELGVHNLPRLIVQAGARQPVGVMIARGDLALDVGFERLAELQEEIVELCRAAHAPVVWATQVFENLVKKGRPTRAEASDATLGQQAQCVMLNKGPHQLEAVRLLNGILRRIDRLWTDGAQRLAALDAWLESQELAPFEVPSHDQGGSAAEGEPAGGTTLEPTATLTRGS
jgi:pyruvate kinase